MRPGTFDLRHVSFDGKPLPHRTLPEVRAPARPPVGHEKDDGGDPADASATDFARWVLVQAGLDPSIYRLPSLNRRVAACLRALHADSIDSARGAILNRHGAAGKALDALLIGVTEFFRDSSVTEDLRARVVPELSRRLGALRIWSAGCSSGEELYSMAMLLSEAGLLERSVLLGTDCREDAVAVARAAAYTAAAVEPLPEALRRRYLEALGTRWRVTAECRERIEWKVADLASDVDAGPWDVILWRNMGIYMTPQASERILSQLIAALRPGGFIVLGKAERATGDLVPVSRCIYRKTGGPHGDHAEHAAR